MAWVLKEAFLNFVPAMLELSQGQSLHEKAIQVGVVQNIRSQALALLDASQEAGRDDMEGEADRNSTLMLLTTLLLGVGVAFVVEGRVGDLGSPGATAAAVNVLSLCLGLALAMLAVTLVLVYMNQRRAKALMRTELAKRAVLRDHVFDIGVRQDLEMLRQHNLDLPRPAATVGSLAGGAAPGATGSPADGSPTDRLRRHVEELHSSMANRPAMAGVSMIESVGTLRRDPVYRCVRPAVDKLIFAASMLLLACSALVFGTRMVETTGTATPLAIFGTCLGLGGSLAVYFGASEMCWCTHRDALSVCALWRCWVNGAPVLAYHVLGYPSVWRNRLRATMEDADDEKRQDWLSAPKAARHLSAVYGGAEMRGKWRRIHTGAAAVNRIEQPIGINVFAPLLRDRKTKIIATLGPKTLPVTEELIRAGVGVARINCSHGSAEYYEKAVEAVRSAVDSINAAGSVDFSDGAREDVCAIAFDTKGPEIRTGMIKDDAELMLAIGDEVVLTTDPAVRSAGGVAGLFVDWAKLTDRVRPGQRIVLDDGVIALDAKTVQRSEGRIKCRVVMGGRLGSRKGVHLPSMNVDLPAVSDKDLEDIACAKRLGADFIFASFIREAGQVEAIRALAGEGAQIIAKIENRQGVENFDAILRAADGIMVARGDLGIEVPLERVFLIQKQLIAKCNLAGKPVICATQMLESMTYAPLPTRAECVDVGNACMEGADAVMLSGETAKGLFPVQTVKTMAKLCKVAEMAEDSHATTRDVHSAIRRDHQFGPEEALASAAVHASLDQGAKAILVVSSKGTTARQLSRFRPRCPILCLTFSHSTARSLQLCKGVHSLVVPEGLGTQAILDEGIKAMQDMGIAGPGDPYLALYSTKPRPSDGDPKTLVFANVGEDEDDTEEL